MKLTQIIAAIQGSQLDNAEEVAQALTEYIDSIESENNKKTNKLTQQIETLTTAIGIETGTAEERLNAAESAVKKLATEKQQLAEEKQSLESQISQNRRQALINSAANTSKASATVLEALIGDEEVKIEGDTVTVDGKPLKDWAAQSKPAFMASLFPETTTSKLPGTPPHSKSEDKNQTAEEPQSAVDSYFEKTYKLPEFIK